MGSTGTPDDQRRRGNEHPLENPGRGACGRAVPACRRHGQLSRRTRRSVRHLEEQTVTVPGGTPLPDRLAEFVAGNPDVAAQDGTIDLGVTELKIGNDQRFVERRLDPGEKCYVYGRAHYDAGAGHRGGEVNVVINGDGVRRFLIADGRERGVAWDVAKIGSVPVVIGVGLLALAVVVV